MTLTSKNAAPAVSSGSDFALLFQVEVFNYILLWEPHLSSVLDYNRLYETGKSFAVRIQQPDGAAQYQIDENLLTKTNPMWNGFKVRPVMHPTENQWEAPLFYSDERSIFFIAPDERVDLVADYEWYYWNDTPVVVK